MERNTGRGIPKIKLDYADKYLLLEVLGYAREGFSDEQIAEILGVAAETFGRNKRKKLPDGRDSLLKQSLDKGRYPLNVMVDNALYRLATGLTLKKTVRIFYEYKVMPDGKTYCCKVIETTKEIPPDLNAIMLWLRAYMPDIYNVKPKKVDIQSKYNAICSEIPRINTIHHVIIPRKLTIAA